jgi:hypothetical protein
MFNILILKGSCRLSAVFIVICVSAIRPCVGVLVLDVTPSCADVSVTRDTHQDSRG